MSCTARMRTWSTVGSGWPPGARGSLPAQRRGCAVETGFVKPDRQRPYLIGQAVEIAAASRARMRAITGVKSEAYDTPSKVQPPASAVDCSTAPPAKLANPPPCRCFEAEGPVAFGTGVLHFRALLTLQLPRGLLEFTGTAGRTLVILCQLVDLRRQWHCTSTISSDKWTFLAI